MVCLKLVENGVWHTGATETNFKGIAVGGRTCEVRVTVLVIPEPAFALPKSDMLLLPRFNNSHPHTDTPCNGGGSSGEDDEWQY